MTKINAKVIADSKNEFGNRITTMVVTMPRIILAEFNTHRMFSRNSASSRAIPFEKMIKSVEENPFTPIAWQKNHKGMQGSEYFNSDDASSNKDAWLKARDFAICQAKLLSKYDVTKQLCNRLLEPFMYHTVIVTATDWENFFSLRCPQYEIGGKYFKSKKDISQDWIDEFLYPNYGIQTYEGWKLMNLEWLKINKGQSEIHMMALAESMYDAYNESIPKQLRSSEWHIPFSDGFNRNEIDKFAWITNKHRNLSPIETEIAISTSYCARISYTVVGEENKVPNYENDIKLHDRLLTDKHLSPFEHCAKAMNEEEYDQFLPKNHPCRGWSANFKGFIQYRKILENNM